MHLSLNQVPLRVKTLRRFVAADPWRDGAPTEWSITLFRMAMEDVAVADAWKLHKAGAAMDGDPGPGGRDLERVENIGLQTPDGTYRLLPRALFPHWREQRFPDAKLPELLHRLEPQLRRIDFRPLPPQPLWWFLGFTMHLLFLCALAMTAAALAPAGSGFDVTDAAPNERGTELVIGTIITLMTAGVCALFWRPHWRGQRLAAAIDQLI